MERPITSTVSHGGTAVQLAVWQGDGSFVTKYFRSFMTRSNTNCRTALVAPTAGDSIREAHSYEYDNNGNIVYVNTSRVKPDMTAKSDTVQRAREERFRLGRGEPSSGSLAERLCVALLVRRRRRAWQKNRPRVTQGWIYQITFTIGLGEKAKLAVVIFLVISMGFIISLLYLDKKWQKKFQYWCI